MNFFGLSDTPYIHVNISVHKICWLDVGTFNTYVLGSDIFTEIYTRTLNDFFHTVVKTNRINNIERSPTPQDLSIQIGSKSKSKTTNRYLVNHFPSFHHKYHHKPFFHFWTKKRGNTRHCSSKVYWLFEGGVNKFFWSCFTKICNPV